MQMSAHLPFCSVGREARTKKKKKWTPSLAQQQSWQCSHSTFQKLNSWSVVCCYMGCNFSCKFETIYLNIINLDCDIIFVRSQIDCLKSSKAKSIAIVCPDNSYHLLKYLFGIYLCSMLISLPKVSNLIQNDHFPIFSLFWRPFLFP